MTTEFGHTRAVPKIYRTRWLYTVMAMLYLIVLSEPLFAGHASGVDITYECLSPCTYRIHFKAYRDCSSNINTIPPINTLTITSGTGCNAPTQIGAWLNVGNTEVTPVCPGTATLCNTPNAALNGVTEHYWIGDFDFCNANCSTYVVSWALCCRNSSITTMNGPQSTAIYTSTTINPLLPSCNSSPTFSTAPIPYICEGQSYVFAQGATDPDGDSLAYHLGACESGPNQTVPYFAWVTPQQPMTPDWDVNLDSLTGDLSIQPNPSGPNPGSIQVGVICIYVEEWRNGVLINTVQRDIQLTVVPCPNNTQPTIPGALNPSGATANGFQVSACYGSSLCFTIRGLDPDPGQVQTITWDQSLAPLGATVVSSINPSVTDTVIGSNPSALFCWTPPAPGTYTFAATITDDDCPLYGFNQYTYTINVTEINVVTLDTGMTCDLGAFCAVPLTGVGPYNFSWSGSGISQTDSCFTHPLPGPGVYPYQLDVVDAEGCITTVVDSVQLHNNVVAEAGVGTAICAGNTHVLGSPPAANPNLVYQWSPVAGLSDPGISDPTLTSFNLSGVPEFQTYTLTVTDTSTNCTSMDSVQLLINPIPEATFNMPEQGCYGDSIWVSYSGSASVTSSFQWTFTNTTQATAGTIGPHALVWNSLGEQEISLTVSQYGCSSPTFRDTITIHDIPSVSIAPSAPQCFNGHGFNLSPIGLFDSTATYQWGYSAGGNAPYDTTTYLNGLVFPAPGTHFATLTVTENGCPSPPDSVELTIHPDPDPSWTFVSGDQCFPANSFDFTATGINDTSATYSWSFQDGMPATSTDTTPTVNFTSQGPKPVTLFVSANGCTAWLLDTIDVYPSPQVDAGPDTSFCEGDNLVQLGALVLGGNAPFQYNWWADTSLVSAVIDSTGDDDPLIMPDSSMFVYVQVVDTNGCESEPDSLWLEMHPRPLVSAGPDTSICDQSSPCTLLSPTIISSAGPYAYEWYPSAGLSNPLTLTPCALPDTTTTYTFAVTDLLTGCRSDANGPDSSAQVTVTVHPQPVADAGLNLSICPDDSVALSGSGSGASGPYIYEWSPTAGLGNPSAASPLASPNLTTTYSLTVYANGCPSVSDTVRLEVHALPVADAGADVEICLGDSVKLNGTAGGDSTATYTFSWGGNSLVDPTQEDPIAAPTTTTTYYIVATSNWGCDSPVDSVTVYLYPTPVAEAGDSAFVCIGEDLQLAGSYSYAQTDTVSDPSLIYFDWSPGQELNDSTLLQPLFTPTQSGWYGLSASYQTCTTHDSVYVTVIASLNPYANADTTVICEGGATQLNAAGGLTAPSFSWTPLDGLDDPNSPSPIASPSSNTLYTVMLEEYGCFDSAHVMVEVLPTPHADFSHTQAIGCPPHEVHFQSLISDPNTFLIWQFGDGSPVENLPSANHSYNAVGNYPVQLIAINPGGCADTADFLQVQVTPPPRLNVVSYPDIPTELQLPAASIELEENFGEAIQWQWVFENGERFEGREINYDFEGPGTYFITLLGMDEKGCWSDTTVGPVVVENGEITIYNVFTPNGDGINDVWQVKYTGDQTFLMRIYDRWGVLMFETRDKMAAWPGTTLQGKPAPESTYYYKIKTGSQQYSGAVDLVR